MARIRVPGAASLWPTETRIPLTVRVFTESHRYAFRRQRHHRRSHSGQLAEPLQIVGGCGHDMIAAMNPRARATDERAFEMKTQNSVRSRQRFRRGDRGRGFGAAVAYQSRQTACGAEPAMGPGDGAHRLRRWLVIEQNAAAAIDLQVDEAGREHHSPRYDLGWPAIRILTARRDTLNHSAVDQDDGIIVPSNSIEDMVRRNCKPSFRRSAGTGPIAVFLTRQTAGPIDLPIGLQYALSRRPAQQRNSGSQQTFPKAQPAVCLPIIGIFASMWMRKTDAD